MAVPGVIEVLKGLRAAADRRGRPAAIHFISASPPQIGQAIRDKLALDGVPYDGIVFKDQLQLLRRGKFGKLREHVGFKLGELFRGRSGRDARFAGGTGHGLATTRNHRRRTHGRAGSPEGLQRPGSKGSSQRP